MLPSKNAPVRSLRVIDSHTEGEPTRVVVEGWPELAGVTMAERRDEIMRDWDHLRSAILKEPRGHDAIIAAILTPPLSPGAVAGIVFCNEAGYLGMCGHGTIGVVRTLSHLGMLASAVSRFDTPAGSVSAELHADGDVTIENVPSYVHASDVVIDVIGLGQVTGDVVYGGNWFFLTELPGIALRLENLVELTRVSIAIRNALSAAGITGTAGAEIDHIELFGAPTRQDADGRNFVLCSGTAYDRSPCGTGTSAKMASLHARGKLPLAKPWRQESIIGSRFIGELQNRDGQIIPTIRGRAFITGETQLFFEADDPYKFGIY